MSGSFRSGIVLWLAAFAALLFCMTCRAGAAGKAAGREDVIALFEELHSRGGEEMQFTCEPSFFQELSENNFALLEVIKVMAGVASAQVRYSDSRHLVMVSDIIWTDAPWASCTTAPETAQAILAFAREGASEGTLLCPPELTRELYGSYAVYAYGAYAGLDSSVMDVRYYTDPGIIRIRNMVSWAVPWYAVSDDVGFLAAVEDAAGKEEETFLIAFERDYFASLGEDPERMEMLVLSSPLLRYATSTNAGACFVRYTDVSYTDVPRLICGTEEGISDSIAAMGAAGVKDFDLILPAALYDEVSENDFRKLEKLEVKGGMRSKSLSYQISGHHLLSYKDADIVSDIASVDSLSQAAEYCMQMADSGAREMTLSCSAEVFSLLLGDPDTEEYSPDGMERIYDLIAMSGILDYSVSYSRSSLIITISVKAYYPGKEIALALKKKDLSGLDERTYDTYEAAQALLDQIMKGTRTDLDKARDIHDALCSRVNYVIDDDTTEDDTAIGALLGGQANCDGYADAFWLLGTMAGLEVRMQHGSSFRDEETPDPSAMQTHMWNLLRIGGEWRMVDVTWDDARDGAGYTWFGIGRDRAARMHIWNEDMSPPLIKATPLEERPANEFCAANEAQLRKALDSAVRQRLGSWSVIFENEEAAPLYETALDEMKKAASSTFLYEWNERMMILSFFDVRYKS